MEQTQLIKCWRFGVLGLLLGTLALLAPVPAMADSLPSGWICTGNCGSSGADGVVTLSPTGNTSYQWVSTYQGTYGVGALPTGAFVGETDGSTLATTTFSATAGEALNFYFNYVTSDGAGYADYAWAELYDAANNPVALLFTARTLPTGTIVPGSGMPSPLATLNPASVPIIQGQTTWSPLGGSSGSCYISPSSGCGYTGWINSNYVIPTSGDYYLVIGVVNWSDTAFDSGLAMDGVTVGGEPIVPPTSPVPEPGTLMLLGSGIVPVVRRILRQG